jgi:hypothetical protein
MKRLPKIWTSYERLAEVCGESETFQQWDNDLLLRQPVEVQKEYQEWRRASRLNTTPAAFLEAIIFYYGSL